MASPEHLHAILSDSFIRTLAGERYYARGVDYFRRGLVESVDQSGNTIKATVSGTEDYAVTLSSDEKKFKFTCECPIGASGGFCKHCVATALVWLAGHAVAPVRSQHVTTDDIHAMLNAQDKQTLVGWLMEWSKRNESLRQRLNMMAGLRSDPSVLVAQVCKDVEKAIRIRGYRDYDQAPVYAARVSTALESIETLLQQNQGVAVIELCEAAMKWLESAVENIDDSDGQMTELMGQVADLHLRACEQAKPEPEMLAVKLLSLNLHGEYGQWGDTAVRYAHVLGEKGLAAFRAAATRAWEKVPFRTTREGYKNGESHYALTHIMESLALQSGDVEQLVSVLERDLSFSNQYLRIAACYQDAGLPDKALHWAESGMARFPDYEGKPLRYFVAEQYRREQRYADALRLLWTEFRANPSLENYRLLETFAREAEDWDDWRDRLLAHLRRLSAEKPSANNSVADSVRFRVSRDRGRSLLVEVFLYERNIEEAWREAQLGGCRDDLWLELAAEREKTHPEDAIPVYLRLGEQSIATTDNGRYERGIQLLEKAAALMHSIGRSGEFALQFDALRLRFKAKRNLQKQAESRRRFLYLG